MHVKFGKKIYTFSPFLYIKIYKKIKSVINKYYFLNYKVIDNRKANIFTKFYIYCFKNKFRMAKVNF